MTILTVAEGTENEVQLTLSRSKRVLIITMGDGGPALSHAQAESLHAALEVLMGEMREAAPASVVKHPATCSFCGGSWGSWGSKVPATVCPNRAAHKDGTCDSCGRDLVDSECPVCFPKDGSGNQG